MWLERRNPRRPARERDHAVLDMAKRCAGVGADPEALGHGGVADRPVFALVPLMYWTVLPDPGLNLPRTPRGRQIGVEKHHLSCSHGISVV